VVVGRLVGRKRTAAGGECDNYDQEGDNGFHGGVVSGINGVLKKIVFVFLKFAGIFFK